LHTAAQRPLDRHLAKVVGFGQIVCKPRRKASHSWQQRQKSVLEPAFLVCRQFSSPFTDETT
jgi:hypothetical protein